MGAGSSAHAATGAASPKKRKKSKRRTSSPTKAAASASTRTSTAANNNITNQQQRNAKKRGEEHTSWIYDFIVAFLKSPPFTVPINNFIDENCIVFDDDEENKLVYSDIHKAFVDLVDGLLTRNLEDIGVSLDHFVAACAKGSENNDVSALVFGQILAVDDFLTFKKMMVQRNVELELEAMRAMQQPNLVPMDASEEDAQLVAALRASTVTGNDQLSQMADMDDEHMMAALQASIVEQEISEQMYEREQADLEYAIMLSLALEKERAEAAANLADQVASGTAAGATNAAAVEEETDAAQAAIAKELWRQEQVAKGQAVETVDAALEQLEETAAGAASATASDAAYTSPVKQRSAVSALSAVAPPTPNAMTLPPVAKPIKRTFVSTSSLPPIAHKPKADAPAIASLVKRADEQFERNASLLKKTHNSNEMALKVKGKVSEEELLRRKKFLKKQRAALLAKRRKNGQEALRKYLDEQKAKGGVRQEPSDLQKQLSEQEMREERRAEMRKALAKRLKQDVLLNERRRMQASAQENYASLDDQLAQAERLRALKEQRRDAEQRALLEQETERQKRLKQLHKSNTEDGAAANFTM